MKTSVTYPLPLDNLGTFEPFIKRFCDSWRAFPNLSECTVHVLYMGGELTDAIKQIFSGMPVEFVRYEGPGHHISAQQWWAGQGENRFEINMTSRCYLHRAGWLEKYTEARSMNGPGLYGIASSLRGGRHHVCTRAHAYDTFDMRKYPYVINTRPLEYFQESGGGCLLDWFRSIGRSAYLVAFTGSYLIGQVPVEIPNGWCFGNQSNVLVWDKHSDEYANSSNKDECCRHVYNHT